MNSGEFLRLCDAVVARAEAYHATVIVNDRVDLAALSGAAGVHVGQEDLSVGDARRLLGEEAIIGYSTHTPEQIAAGVRTAATYLAVGPVFGSRTKDTGYDAVGLDLIREARRTTARPVVAIGGATMVAVISDLLVGGDPTSRVRAYQTRCARR
jgi:thiamine-phosphate pyrophosphorylase